VFTDRSDEMIKTKRQQNYSQGYNLSKETLKLLCKSEFEGGHKEGDDLGNKWQSVLAGYSRENREEDDGNVMDIVGKWDLLAECVAQP